MVFSSLTFLYSFLPSSLLLYYFTPPRYRSLTLFLTSLIFYAWGEPAYITLMLYSTLLDYTCGRMIERHRDHAPKARFWLWVSLLGNLGLLGYFKYSDWLLGSFNRWLGLQVPLPGLRLPIGISFYTFQTMSYTIDVYRGDTDAQTSIIDFGAYVTLFPQLIAGPIVRYVDVARELKQRVHTLDRFGLGVRHFAIGLGKKVLLANSCGALFEQIKAGMPAELTLAGAWLGIVAYSCQIYFDFSGYSDMAVGLGHMLGFTFPQNFNYPFISRSVSEFWRRWHISMGSWFRDYVYIPLGGNRCGELSTYRNLAIVWLLTGIWHGAAWNFVWWGAYFAVVLALERLLLLRWLRRLPAFACHLYTLLLIAFSFAVFAFSRGDELLSYLKGLSGLGTGGLFAKTDAYLLSTNLVLLLICILAATPLPKQLFHRCEKVLAGCGGTRLAAWLSPLMVLGILTLCTAYLVDSSYNPFLYFRF